MHRLGLADMGCGILVSAMKITKSFGQLRSGGVWADP